MPVIACTSCKARFKVKIDTLGKAIRCPKCKDEFKAIALHSAPRGKTDHGPIVYAAMGVGAILVALLVHSMVTGGAPSENEAAAETVSKIKDVRRERPAEPDDVDDASLSPEDLLAKRATTLLEALRDPSDPRLPGWIAYEAMHAERKSQGLETQSWVELPADESYGKREEYLNFVLGDDELRQFARASSVVSASTLRLGSGKGKVAARIKNNLTEKIQDVTLHFVGLGGQWKLAGIEREPITTVEALAEAAEDAARGTRSESTVLERIGRRRNPLGEVAEVEPYPDTGTSVTSDIQRQIGLLTDLSATTEAGAARRKLVDIGKHAVPHLLNALVPLDLENPSDLQVGNRVAQTLGQLTGADHPIVPGMNEASLIGEGSGDNEANRRKWFGWWRDNKGSYTGPPDPTFGEGDGG